MDEVIESSGTATDTTGGVGNGQATGTGQVSEDFNVGSAVESISSDLGFAKAAAPAEGEKPATTAAPVTPVVGSKEAADAEAAAINAANAKATAPTDIPPKTWKTDEAAEWATIPASAKAAIARREEEMFQGIEKYKGIASFGSSVQNAIQPFVAVMQANGIDPVQNIGSLMNAHYMLATGSAEQKANLFQQLARDYKIDLQSIADQPNTAAYTDPQVAALQQELQQLKSGQASLQQARFQETQSKVQSEVNAFAADPANQHFDEVADDIARLLSLDKQMTLAKAYETAVWANPVTRGKEIARQDAEKQTKAAEEATKKLADARKATAANVRVQPKAGAATLPLGTMDDTMASTLANIKNRSN